MNLPKSVASLFTGFLLFAFLISLPGQAAAQSGNYTYPSSMNAGFKKAMDPVLDAISALPLLL